MAANSVQCNHPGFVCHGFVAKIPEGIIWCSSMALFGATRWLTSGSPTKPFELIGLAGGVGATGHEILPNGFVGRTAASTISLQSVRKIF